MVQSTEVKGTFYGQKYVPRDNEYFDMLNRITARKVPKVWDFRQFCRTGFFLPLA